MDDSKNRPLSVEELELEIKREQLKKSEDSNPTLISSFGNNNDIESKFDVELVSDDAVLDNFLEGELNRDEYSNEFINNEGLEEEDIRVQSQSIIRKKGKVEKQSQSMLSDSVYIRNYPRVLMAKVRAEFPDATNTSDALAAFTVVSLGKPVEGLSEAVMDLVANYQGENKLLTVDERLSDIDHQLRGNYAKLQRQIDEIKLGTSWLLFDKFGFRKEHPVSIEKSNILENGVDDMMTRLESQSESHQKLRKIREGRPKR